MNDSQPLLPQIHAVVAPSAGAASPACRYRGLRPGRRLAKLIHDGDLAGKLRHSGGPPWDRKRRCCRSASTRNRPERIMDGLAHALMTVADQSHGDGAAEIGAVVAGSDVTQHAHRLGLVRVVDDLGALRDHLLRVFGQQARRAACGPAARCPPGTGQRLPRKSASSSRRSSPCPGRGAWWCRPCPGPR